MPPSPIDLSAHGDVLAGAFACDSRYRFVDGVYPWVGNPTGRCACHVAGYGDTRGRCMLHAGERPGDDHAHDGRTRREKKR